ncbi:MAG: hypothetical protein HYZ42_09565 [Bacteroidetes bacterium]|nr:hypothetical protein [Bacteroidota bacterium]
MKLIITVLVTSFFLVNCVTKKDNGKEDGFEEKINKLVISEDKIGLEYFFKVIQANGVLEFRVTYLGKVKTRKNKELLFINNTVFTGLYEDSKKASTVTCIYDDNYNKIGQYFVGGPMDAPNRIEKSKLIFDFNNSECNQMTSIDFSDSIPHQIFVSCTKEGGNLWVFDRENK